MPFEFSGAPPALLDSSGAFSSFASPSQTTSTPPTNASKSFSDKSQQRPSFHFGGPSSFGAASPFASTTKPSSPSFGGPASFGAASSFGSALRPPFGSTASNLSSPSPQPECQPSTSLALVASSQQQGTSSTLDPLSSDPLARALDRASKGRPAIFGRSDLAADGILKNIFSENKHEIPALLAALHHVDSSSPAVTNFIRSLFNEFIQTQTRREEQPTEETAASTTSQATEKASGDITDDESVASFNTQEPPIPRNHWRVKEVSRNLADVLLDEGYIWYDEGARVLADYIIDLAYDHDQNTIVSKVCELLVRQANDAAVDDVVYWARCKLQAVDRDRYFDRDDPRNASRYNAGNVAVARMASDISNGKQSSPQDASSNVRESAEAASTMPKDKPKERFKGTPEDEFEDEDKPFRFLDLPAELRNWVYFRLMVPGYMSVDHHGSRENAKDKTVKVKQITCETQILATCRQIHNEAKDILYENTVCVTSSNMSGMYPVINPNLLPSHALPKLTSLTFVMVACKPSREIRHDIRNLNWTQFQQMTGLTKLRICIVEREDDSGDTTRKRWILEHIIDRVPKDCELAFETDAGFEDDFAQAVIEERDNEKAKYPELRIADAYEVDGELLSTLAEPFKSGQGCKSGSQRDFRFPERSLNLKPLVPTSEVNPSFVLGGSQ